MKAQSRSIGGNPTVAEYTYNGLGYRTGWHYDANASGTVNGSDPWYYFAYDERWRLVSTYRGTDTYAKEQFIHHNAGAAGRGGSSYIDSVIMRERDMTHGWTGAADGTLEKRHYYAQNWRNDVVAVLTSAGLVVEEVKYSSYGVPTSLLYADYTNNAALDSVDLLTFLIDYYTPTNTFRTDVDLDGTLTSGDTTAYNTLYFGWSGDPFGYGILSSTGNRIGYAGYEYDPIINKYHVRNRVLDPGLGRWTKRDPIGYVDGADLYEYVGSRPETRLDAMGLCINLGGSIHACPASGAAIEIDPPDKNLTPKFVPPAGYPDLDPSHDPADMPVPPFIGKQRCDLQSKNSTCASLCTTGKGKNSEGVTPIPGRGVSCCICDQNAETIDAGKGIDPLPGGGLRNYSMTDDAYKGYLSCVEAHEQDHVRQGWPRKTRTGDSSENCQHCEALRTQARCLQELLKKTTDRDSQHLLQTQLTAVTDMWQNACKACQNEHVTR